MTSFSDWVCKLREDQCVEHLLWFKTYTPKKIKYPKVKLNSVMPNNLIRLCRKSCEEISFSLAE